MARAGDELRVEVTPWGPDGDTVHRVAREALRHDRVREQLDGAEHRVVSVGTVPPDVANDGDPVEPSHVRATLYDYSNERTLFVDAPVDGSPDVAVASSSRQPLPSSEERAAALAVLQDDAHLGPALREGRLVPFRPMPPLIPDGDDDERVARTVAVGLRDPGDPTGDAVVGVALGSRTVRRFDDTAVPASRARRGRCGVPYAGQPTADRGRPGQARLVVRRGGEELWRLIAVRPADSSGVVGSGIELRWVSYRGKRVLRRAHVPILNVRYDHDACGPYRDWQYEEGMLEAHGTDIASGFRRCPTPARTVLDSGSDRGNFLGVAVYEQGEELVLVSEMEAGWYRYVSQWRLHPNGTIRPRFGFGAVTSACVCETHHHHVYWRLDFDVVSPAHNSVEEFNDPPVGDASRWHTLRHEIRRPRNADRGRRWRVVNTAGGEAVTLSPGRHDGHADPFGVGDMWALRRRNGQLDDGQGFTSDPHDARAHLDRFVSGETIRDTNVVLWYAAHFSHDVRAHDTNPASRHVVGPTLSLDGW
ncbi:MAG: hypothetical protein M4D85_01340 [Actinomycetota bacterium]|nr:hypothetical protein [Actinomycetota bacterium]